MKKRTAKKPSTPVATTARFESIPEHQTNEASRMASGFDPANWHAAIRLQCAVRDSLRRPVNLAQALEYSRLVFEKIHDSALQALCKQFDETVETERREKEAETKRIAATAGQR
jgi:hypothetical protein